MRAAWQVTRKVRGFVQNNRTDWINDVTTASCLTSIQLYGYYSSWGADKHTKKSVGNLNRIATPLCKT